MLASTLVRHITVLEGWATDGQIEACNIEAARLYGFETTQELIGQYLSSLRPESESAKARARITAWWAGKKNINDESIQLIRRQDGEIVSVTKRVKTIVGADGWARWHTTLEVCSQHCKETWLAPDDCQVSEEQVIEVCGHYTYASLRNALTTLTPLNTILPQNVWVDKHDDCPGVALHWTEGDSARMRHLYVCQVCGHMWFGQGVRPLMCANRATCGTETWWR